MGYDLSLNARLHDYVSTAMQNVDSLSDATGDRRFESAVSGFAMALFENSPYLRVNKDLKHDFVAMRILSGDSSPSIKNVAERLFGKKEDFEAGLASLIEKLGSAPQRLEMRQKLQEIQNTRREPISGSTKALVDAELRAEEKKEQLMAQILKDPDNLMYLLKNGGDEAFIRRCLFDGDINLLPIDIAVIQGRTGDANQLYMQGQVCDMDRLLKAGIGSAMLPKNAVRFIERHQTHILKQRLTPPEPKGGLAQKALGVIGLAEHAPKAGMVSGSLPDNYRNWLESALPKLEFIGNTAQLAKLGLDFKKLLNENPQLEQKIASFDSRIAPLEKKRDNIVKQLQQNAGKKLSPEMNQLRAKLDEIKQEIASLTRERNILVSGTVKEQLLPKLAKGMEIAAKAGKFSGAFGSLSKALITPATALSATAQAYNTAKTANDKLFIYDETITKLGAELSEFKKLEEMSESPQKDLYRLRCLSLARAIKDISDDRKNLAVQGKVAYATTALAAATVAIAIATLGLAAAGVATTAAAASVTLGGASVVTNSSSIGMVWNILNRPAKVLPGFLQSWAPDVEKAGRSIIAGGANLADFAQKKVNEATGRLSPRIPKLSEIPENVKEVKVAEAIPSGDEEKARVLEAMKDPEFKEFVRQLATMQGYDAAGLDGDPAKFLEMIIKV